MDEQRKNAQNDNDDGLGKGVAIIVVVILVTFGLMIFGMVASA